MSLCPVVENDKQEKQEKQSLIHVFLVFPIVSCYSCLSFSPEGQMLSGQMLSGEMLKSMKLMWAKSSLTIARLHIMGKNKKQTHAPEKKSHAQTISMSQMDEKVVVGGGGVSIYIYIYIYILCCFVLFRQSCKESCNKESCTRARDTTSS